MEHYLRLRYLALAAVACLYLVLAGCGGGSSRSVTGKLKDIPGGSGGSWTVLVYLNADNDLEPFGILNFNQMEKVGSTDNVKIVVQMDRSSGYDTSNGNWVGARRYLVTKDSDENTIHSLPLQNMGPCDMGNPDTLRDFIQWGQSTYPADHYCLVIWNHGSGWRSAKGLRAVSRDISFDDTSGTSIRTTQLPYALSSASPQIDIIAMDACMMQMLEVSYEIRNSAKFVVASEASPPGEGYVYDKWLAKLVASPSMSSRELGTVIAQEFVKAYVDQTDVAESVLDLSKMSDVAQATDELVTAIIPHKSTDASPLRTARRNAQAYEFDFYKDLTDYAALVNQLVPDPAITSARAKLQSAMSSAVIFEAHTGSTMDRSHGLSVYVPEPGDYITRYETLSFSKDYPNWAEFIKAQQE